MESTGATSRHGSWQWIAGASGYVKGFIPTSTQRSSGAKEEEEREISGDSNSVVVMGVVVLAVLHHEASGSR